jgi:hypothetical protein
MYNTQQDEISKKNLISYFGGNWMLNKKDSQKLEGSIKPLLAFSPLYHITK